MLPVSITKAQINGFRSLVDVEVSLSPLNVLIGPNGAGKSNFIRFFEMMNWMLISKKLQEFVTTNGGADDQLYLGSKTSPRIDAEISVRAEHSTNDYAFQLTDAHPDRLMFTREACRFSRDGYETKADWNELGSGHTETLMTAAARDEIPGVNSTTARTVLHLLRNIHVFQFHDTSGSAAIHNRWDATDSRHLRRDAGNLGPVLLDVKENDFSAYEMIRRQIARVLPNFGNFVLEEEYGRVLLRWKPKTGDKTFGSHLTSDGSLRLFALMTLLNLPENKLPNVVFLDEPELGLHPAAITLIGHMIKRLSTKRQVILATQSPLLVNCFDPENILVTECDDRGRTSIRNLVRKDYEAWLEDEYAVGDLWLKNLIGGRP